MSEEEEVLSAGAYWRKQIAQIKSAYGNVKGPVQDAGKFGRKAGRKIGNTVFQTGASIGGTTSGAIAGGSAFVGRHRKALMIGAGAAAVYTSHPIKQISQNSGEVLYGDPNIFHEVARIGVQGGIVDALNQNGVSTQWNVQEGMSALSHEEVANQYRGPNPNPDGSIVFGLYSNRLK